MNLTDLRPILTAYRQQAQAAWTPETAHAEFEGKAGDPAGQCGVTSAWLQQRLHDDHGIDSWYMVGQVWLNGARLAEEHCWLEIGDGLDRIVIDPTADQLPGVSDLPVLYAAHAELLRDGIHYWSFETLDYDDILLDPVIDRLGLLEAAVTR